MDGTDNSGPNVAAPVQDALGLNASDQAAWAELQSLLTSTGQATGYATGQSAAQGALDTLSPYTGYIVLGIGAIVIALALGGR